MIIKIQISHITFDENGNKETTLCDEYINLDEKRLNIFIDDKNIFSLGNNKD